MSTTITPAQIQAVSVNQSQMQGAQTLDEGAFSQLLMEMLGGGTGGEGQASLLDTLFGLGGEQQQGETDNPWNNAAALQMAAAGILPPDMYLNLVGMQDDATLLADYSNSANPVGMTTQQNDLLMQLLNGAGGEVLPENSLPGEFSGLFRFATAGTAAKAEQPLTDASAIPVTVEAEQNSGDAENLFSGMEQFRRSVSEAQKALESEKGKKDVVSPDIEALQQKADTSRLDTAGIKLGATDVLPSKEDVAAQMKEHILKNLTDGKDEFVVKLKPESLGEITVKMQEKDGKITLSILTANPQTAKLLNETADALRNTLRPLQAEIREIIPRPEQSGASQQGNWLGGGFDSFQRQQFAQQQHSGSHSSSFLSGMEADEEAAAEQGIQGIGLNAYI